MKKTTKIKAIFYTSITLSYLFALLCFILYVKRLIPSQPYAIFSIFALLLSYALKRYKVKIGEDYSPPLVISYLEEDLSRVYFGIVLSIIGFVLSICLSLGTSPLIASVVGFLVLTFYAIVIKRDLRKAKIEEEQEQEKFHEKNSKTKT